jgi:hypothetical protein
MPNNQTNGSKAPHEIDYFNNELIRVPPSNEDENGVMNFIWQWNRVTNQY